MHGGDAASQCPTAVAVRCMCAAAPAADAPAGRLAALLPLPPCSVWMVCCPLFPARQSAAHNVRAGKCMGPSGSCPPCSTMRQMAMAAWLPQVEGFAANQHIALHMHNTRYINAACTCKVSNKKFLLGVQPIHSRTALLASTATCNAVACRTDASSHVIITHPAMVLTHRAGRHATLAVQTSPAVHITCCTWLHPSKARQQLLPAMLGNVHTTLPSTCCAPCPICPIWHQHPALKQGVHVQPLHGTGGQIGWT